MKAVVLRKIGFDFLSSFAIKKIKDVKSITVSFSYTTHSQPGVSKGKDFTFDIDKTKATITNLFHKGECDMSEYQFKVIWLNEMGEEQISYHETEEDRNTKMQALADDGYSPIWREA